MFSALILAATSTAALAAALILALSSISALDAADMAADSEEAGWEARAEDGANGKLVPVGDVEDTDPDCKFSTVSEASAASSEGVEEPAFASASRSCAMFEDVRPLVGWWLLGAAKLEPEEGTMVDADKLDRDDTEYTLTVSSALPSPVMRPGDSEESDVGWAVGLGGDCDATMSRLESVYH